jgi:hypothetical protein
VNHKSGIGFLIVCVASLVLAGCGGGGGGGGDSHTYVLTGLRGAGSGIYVTIVSPVAIPTDLMTKNGAKIVGQAQGPQVCSYTKTVQGGHGSSAFLNGKTVTLKLNGSSQLTSLICGLLKKTPFNADKIGAG